MKEMEKGSHDPTNEELALLAGVSVSTIKRTKRALRLRPDLLDAMIAGEITPTQIIKEAESKSLSEDKLKLQNLKQACQSYETFLDFCENADQWNTIMEVYSKIRDERDELAEQIRRKK